jgi:hypothetical protein
MRIRKGYRNLKPKIRDSSDLKMIVFLNRTSQRAFNTRKLSEAESVIKMYANDDLENSYHKFYQYMTTYGYLFPEKAKRASLDIRNVKCYSADFSEDKIEKLAEWIVGKNG